MMINVIFTCLVTLFFIFAVWCISISIITPHNKVGDASWVLKLQVYYGYGLMSFFIIMSVFITIWFSLVTMASYLGGLY
jgi:hypothetical protein